MMLVSGVAVDFRFNLFNKISTVGMGGEGEVIGSAGR